MRRNCAKKNQSWCWYTEGLITEEKHCGMPGGPGTINFTTFHRRMTVFSLNYLEKRNPAVKAVLLPEKETAEKKLFTITHSILHSRAVLYTGGREPALQNSAIKMIPVFSQEALLNAVASISYVQRL